MPEFKPVLVTSERVLSSPDGGTMAESWHAGWVIATDTDGKILYQTPGAEAAASFLRSSAKPFQAWPLVAHGINQELTPEQLAVCCASHTGSPYHQKRVGEILARAGLDASALQCGVHAPIDIAEARSLVCDAREPSPLHNNCSGKHAGMLLVCVRQGWDTEGYLDPQHPLQREILAVIAETSGAPEIAVGVDGCSAPVFHMPLIHMARLFAKLGSEARFEPLVSAMTGFPVAVGGEGRADTVLMQASRGALLAKVGAEGLLVVSRVGRGEGLAVKIADGSSAVRELVLFEVLYRLGWLDETALADPRVLPFRDAGRYNARDRGIGAYRFHLDEP